MTTLAAAFLLVQLQGLPDAGALLKPLRAEQSDAYVRQSKGETVDMAAVQADIKTKAIAAVTGVDATKIPADQAENWSELYRLAGKLDESVKLSETSINFLATKAWGQQTALLSAYLDRGDKAKILQTLDFALGVSVPMIGQMGEFVIYGLTPKYGETDPQYVLKAYDLLLRRFNPDRVVKPGERKWDLFALGRLGANRDALLYKIGRQKEALADIAKLKLKVASDPDSLKAVEEVSNQLLLSGRPAPEIVAQRKIGNYSGLAALKGKVVLVDFFAHWCGPCKRAFPAMEDLYASAKPKGLEIIGVTSLQGYYEDQKDLKPDAEFALMRDKFVPKHKLPWPMVFEKDKAATTAYGVSVIPHLVIIDRTGKVRRIVVGYTPAEFENTKAYVAKLLAEKA